MAHIMTKRGNLDNIVTYEHMCDYYSDLQNINMDERTLGSVALVLRGQSGGVEIYMTDSNKQWVPLSVGSGNSGTNNNSGSSEFIKYVTELPTENINPDIVYLVKTTDDQYDQYMYLEGNWVKIGTTDADDLNKNTLNIKNGTGDGSIVEGLEKWTYIDSKTGESVTISAKNIASGALSHAEGNKTQALAGASHAEGQSTRTDINATGSHAEGQRTIAGAPYSHAEGVRTVAGGNAAHVEGRDSVAIGEDSHAQNKCTRTFAVGSHVEGGGTIAVASERYTHISGVNNALDAAPPVGYQDNEKITVRVSAHEAYYIDATGKHTDENNEAGKGMKNLKYVKENVTTPYYQDTNIVETLDPTDGTMKPRTTQLFLGKYAEVVGNGRDDAHRSNARTLDWYGNSYVAGETISYGDIIAKTRTATSKTSNGTAVAVGTGGNLIAEGGSLTLGTGANAVTITATQLQQLLALLN